MKKYIVYADTYRIRNVPRSLKKSSSFLCSILLTISMQTVSIFIPPFQLPTDLLAICKHTIKTKLLPFYWLELHATLVILRQRVIYFTRCLIFRCGTNGKCWNYKKPTNLINISKKIRHPVRRLSFLAIRFLFRRFVSMQERRGKGEMVTEPERKRKKV